MSEPDNTPDQLKAELARIEQAIAAQEGFRGILSNEQIEAALKELLEKQAAIQATLTGSGAIAQGQGAVAVGEKGVYVGKSVEGNVIAGDQNRLIDLGGGTYIEKQEIIHPPIGPDAASLRTAYLSHLFETTSRLSLAGVDPKAASNAAKASLNLGEVYTALLTLTPESHERLLRGEAPERETRRLSALAQLDQQRKLVLLGDPGGGKSTLSIFWRMCLAGESLGRSEANLTHLTAPLPQ
ncbi:MAG: hypothetical protein HC875_33755 [Anaerolineales bacterium]|nr:hypothetical protein [Anaerolineales bacterium]